MAEGMGCIVGDILQAGTVLKPYQGLKKQNLGSSTALDGRNSPKTLPGIEIEEFWED